MRLIDADKLNATLKGLGEEGKENWSADEIKEYIVDYQPTVDAEPVVHAHWEYHRDGLPYCSRCGDETYADRRYCPSCGAKMDEKK